MKKLDINQLDDNDEEICEIFISSGRSIPVARTLTYLKKVDTATSIDLEGNRIAPARSKHSDEGINPA